jgi:predicted dehydrogenase
MSRPLSRREFLSTSTAAEAAVAVTARRARGQTSASSTLNIGLIGCGGQGTHDVRAMTEADGKRVTVAALADVDPRHLDEFADFIQEKRGRRPDTYKDFRRIIDRKDIDVVVVATPDHWHAIPVILACQAGKDVVCEYRRGFELPEV